MSTPDPFAPQLLFPLPIFTTVLAGFAEHQPPMLADILELQRKYPGVTRSNRTAWHSGEEFLRHRSEHVAWMLARVVKFAQGALASTYGQWQAHELKLAGAWANVLGPGGWNAPHHHFPMHWSGVFYVSTPGIAENPPGDAAGHIEFLNPTPWLSPMGQGGNAAYKPKPGLTVLFPASLYHYVHPHASAEPRVSIAYNLIVVPRTAA